MKKSVFNALIMLLSISLVFSEPAYSSISTDFYISPEKTNTNQANQANYNYFIYAGVLIVLLIVLLVIIWCFAKKHKIKKRKSRK